jgi:hypothetical protein
MPLRDGKRQLEELQVHQRQGEVECTQRGRIEAIEFPLQDGFHRARRIGHHRHDILGERRRMMTDDRRDACLGLGDPLRSVIRLGGALQDGQQPAALDPTLGAGQGSDPGDASVDEVIIRGRRHFVLTEEIRLKRGDAAGRGGIHTGEAVEDGAHMVGHLAFIEAVAHQQILGRAACRHTGNGGDLGEPPPQVVLSRLVERSQQL